MDDRLRVLIGQRAKRLRVDAGRSLREQARRAEISASALSALENGRGGVSLVRLQRLARDFGLPVTELLAEEPAFAPGSAAGTAPGAPAPAPGPRDAAGPPGAPGNAGNAGDDAPATGATVELMPSVIGSAPGVQRGRGVFYQVLGRRPHTHLIQPYALSFAPGGGYERDLMGHRGEEFTYVLVGEVDLVFAGASHRLRQGDAARFHTESPHAFRNASRQGIAVVIGAAAPPW